MATTTRTHQRETTHFLADLTQRHLHPGPTPDRPVSNQGRDLGAWLVTIARPPCPGATLNDLTDAARRFEAWRVDAEVLLPVRVPRRQRQGGTHGTLAAHSPRSKRRYLSKKSPTAGILACGSIW
jgi:hypothetical protein